MLPRLGAIVLLALLAPAADLTPAQRQANIDSFEKVWKTVRDRHWEARPGGLDWQAVHDELRPKIEKAATTGEARAILSDMLGRLHQTHFGIVPTDVYEEFQSPGAVDGQPGIDVRVLDGHAIVTGLDPGSPAAAKGVRPGWEILAVDGRELAPALQRVTAEYRDSTLLDLHLSRAVLARLNGPAGHPADIEFLDGAGRRVRLRVDRVQPRGSLVQFGGLPPFYFWEESKMLRPDIAYIRFNAFFDPEALAKTFGDAVAGCAACSGFIVDLRGNPGGLGVLAMGVGGWFVDRNGLQLGTMLMKGARLNFVIFPRPAPFRGPLAVLVDGCSASTSEIFAGGMQDIHRARVFGTHTAGAALPSLFEVLPNGDGFQYAIANYVSQGGKPLEGIGVTPDEEVKLTRQALLAGRDPVIDAAIRWIETVGPAPGRPEE
ncbi:MAG TPA: S41 family peptidase [Bryobacteraceae bacterium]|jgi:carboxyl-terminal processing protease|nr:S41 family peptidase [Bryobacteraceae bacterium]